MLAEDQKDQVSSLQYARAVHCVDFPGMPQVTVEEFLTAAKEDWNMRADSDAASYVCAMPRAEESELRRTGREDVAREFMPRLKNYKHATVLEVGCGFGRMSIFIADQCTRFYGVDISGRLIKQAMRRLHDYRTEFGTDGQARHGTFLEGDGCTVEPVEDGVVDVAFEFIVFQHIPVEDVIISYIDRTVKS